MVMESLRVCASRSGGGTSDNKTLPKYSPRPACDALEAGTARLRGRPHRMMHKRVVLAAADHASALPRATTRRLHCEFARYERSATIHNTQSKGPVERGG